MDRGGSNDDDWDGLFADPHAAQRMEGRRHGAIDGRTAGLARGYAAGRSTATDLGLELGFARGVLDGLRRQMSSSSSLGGDERLRRSVDGLQRALDDFPSPAAIFRDKQQPAPLREGDPMGEIDPSKNDNKLEYEDSFDDADDDDVAGKLQRVRARFKLLLVQLGLPHFSLKHDLEQAAAISGGNNAASPQPKDQQQHQEQRPIIPQPTSDW